MKKKLFHIKPKNWPKELTFEEFKSHNSTLSEELLINYYQKYLQEYIENNSRHLEYFEDLKNQISEEIKLLKNNRNWDYDGDKNVGPTGAGRFFRSPLEGTKHAIHFEGTDDAARAGLDGVGNEPSDGTLKPYSQITVSAWIKADGIYNVAGASGYFRIVSAAKSGGWVMYFYNKRMNFFMHTDDGDGTSTSRNVYSPFGAMKSTGVHHTETGWHYVVGTYDGRYVNLYVDGNLTSGGNETVDVGSQSTGESGSAGAIFYKESNKKHLIDISIGSMTDVDSSGDWEEFTEFYSGSIAEVAIWDKALNATTISEIYENNVSGSKPKFDLSYSGYNQNPDKPDHLYDLNDEGLSYKNVGSYAGNLQGWWKMDENTGTTIHDSSSKGRHMTLYNGPTWSGSHAPGGS